MEPTFHYFLPINDENSFSVSLIGMHQSYIYFIFFQWSIKVPKLKNSDVVAINKHLQMQMIYMIFYLLDQIVKQSIKIDVLAPNFFPAFEFSRYFFPPVQHGRKSGKFSKPGKKIVFLKNVLISFSL